MNKEIAKEIPHDLKFYTPREAMWLKFEAHETPATLRLADNYLNLLRPNDKVLDVGCAFGRVANFLAREKNVEVVGVDINRTEIRHAEKIKTSEKVKFKVMDGTQLECSENSFDAVVMAGVIGGVEVGVRKDLLKEAFRVLKSGGTVAVAEYGINLNDSERREKYKADFEKTGEWGSKIILVGKKKLLIVKHFAGKELRNLLSGAGFISIAIRKHSTESAGIGDGKVEKRPQYTVWGVKP